jgi:NhaP-type Na+/H+ or K+/H+ antiporter
MNQVIETITILLIKSISQSQLFLTGVVSIIGSDDLLACFIAGNSFTWDDWFRVETENAHMAEVVDVLLNLSMFVYIGATVVRTFFLIINFGMYSYMLNISIYLALERIR